MTKKIILTILAVAICIISFAQNKLKLKLDSIAKTGLEKGIPGIQVIISDNEGSTIYNYGHQDIERTTEVNDSTNWRCGGHTGSDNSSLFDRIKNILGAANIKGQENLVGGSSPSASVVNLLIDGGIGSRGHRYNIINPEWTHVGCYWAGKAGNIPDNYVQNFAILKQEVNPQLHPNLQSN